MLASFDLNPAMGRAAVGAIILSLGLLYASSAGRAAEIVTYDFSAAALAAGVPADNDVTTNASLTAKFHVIDGANSGISNPNHEASPPVFDQSGLGRDLVHENRLNSSDYLPSNGSAYARYVRSNASNGGSGAYGAYASDGNSTIIETLGTISNTELTSVRDGFSIYATFEVERTFGSGASLPLVSINNVTVALQPNGKLGATVTGTFGPLLNDNPVFSNNTILKSSAPGATRPVYHLLVTYNTRQTVGTSDDLLSLYLNGNLEAQTSAFLNTSRNNGNLQVFGFGKGQSVLSGVMLESLQIVQGAPEPSSAVAIVMGASVLLLRRKS